MGAERILAVDDEAGIRELCRDVLAGAGYAVDTATGTGTALERLRDQDYDLVLTDLRMPGRNGLELLHAARAVQPDLPVVVFTGYPSIEVAVEAIREGAEDFLPKPFNTEHLCHVVGRVLARRRLEQENQLLRMQLGESFDAARLRGRSPALRELLGLIHKAAPTDSSVLILGESGTGKELVARSLHGLSRRAARPFVPLDCTAMPETLLESELFGYEKGAFTGATARRPGLMESAAGGTLFLDEIGDLSAALQAKLLRVLEERRVRRLGGQELLPVDVRVVAATNVDLPEAIRQGRFREDLYFRLNVIPLRVPPLRERLEDLSELVQGFLEEFAGRRQDPPRRVDPQALAALEAYAWPGNVRELRNVIERLVSLAAGEEITLADLPAEILASAGTGQDRPGMSGFREAKRRVVDRFERDYLHKLLATHAGNVTRSADASGMNRSAFQRLMRKHRLRSADYRRPLEALRR